MSKRQFSDIDDSFEERHVVRVQDYNHLVSLLVRYAQIMPLRLCFF